MHNKILNPAYIKPEVPEQFFLSCLFNDGRKIQSGAGKFLTTHLFLENPLQIKLKETACSGATEET